MLIGDPLLSFKIPKTQAESLRNHLPIDYSYKPKSIGDYVYFAVDLNSDYQSVVEKFGIEVEDVDLVKAEGKPSKLRDILRKYGIDRNISSYEIVGDIAVIEIPEDLIDEKEIIGRALLEMLPRVKTVLWKKSGMKGEWRIREVEVIAGENKTETVYSENGCRFKVDLSKMYYSTRLSTERRRIAELVRQSGGKENVLVPFAGYGPFAITIGKYNPNSKVVGIEINPVAAKYFEENIRLNKLNNVRAICGDATEVIPNEFPGWADRIVMPLPKDTLELLPRVIVGGKDQVVLHVYSFSPSEDPYSPVIGRITSQLGDRYTVRVLNQRIVRPYSPTTVQVVLDVDVRRV